MIVDPDFLDHWRTTMLHDLLGADRLAAVYVLRLWAHCQSRKSTHFAIPTMGIKALCRYAGDAAVLESALADSGFILRTGQSVEVLGWAEQNAKLIANWKNGATGGRPPKVGEEPKTNQTITHPEPTETQPEPIREEEIREDETKPSSKSKTEATPRASRLPPDWTASPEYVEFCQANRPDLDPIAMQEKFRDYWAGVPGKQGLKLSWLGTWRNFVRSERALPQPRGSPQSESKKFDPLAYVNRDRGRPHERTITIDDSGEPI